MAAIDTGYWGGTLNDLETLIGPTRSVPGPFSAFEVLEGTYRGAPVRATWLGRVNSGNVSGSTLHLGASLGDRPIRTYVWRRQGSTIFGPTATTGDGAFDQMYIASARPPEVVNEAFDDDVRAMIRRRWPDADTSLNADDGWVTIAAGSSRPGPRGMRPAPTADQLQSILDDVILTADRLASAYDRRRASIAANDGSDAAVAWEQACRSDLTKQRNTGRLIAFVVIAAVAAAVAVVVSQFV